MNYSVSLGEPLFGLQTLAIAMADKLALVLFAILSVPIIAVGSIVVVVALTPQTWLGGHNGSNLFQASSSSSSTGMTSQQTTTTSGPPITTTSGPPITTTSGPPITTTSVSVSHTSSATTTSSTVSTVNLTKVAVVSVNASIQQFVNSSLSGGTIPVLVNLKNDSYAQVKTQAPTFQVTDTILSNVSGIQISITALSIVSEPRIVLVNVSHSATIADLVSNTLIVTLDGTQIPEASSFSQISSPQSGEQAKYAVLGTSSGVQILVLIPHFSTHIIRIVPQALPPATTASASSSTSSSSTSPSGIFLPVGVASVVIVIAIVAFSFVLRNRRKKSNS